MPVKVVTPSERRVERRHAEVDDKRSPFARDRDRILYSTACQRLADASQVVAPGEVILFHNRLTHSFEVAQIARRCAERLIEDSTSSEDMTQFVSPDVTEAAALAHDIGHPPFGHIGEQVLDSFLQEMGLEEGYEGNAQTLRILGTLSIRSSSFDGLNLTRATLNACLKYPWRKGHAPNGSSKFGAYKTEAGLLTWVRKGVSNSSPAVEAQIMDWADDVAYSVHDLCDFYKAGLIPLHLLAEDEVKFHEFWDSLDHEFKMRDGSTLDADLRTNLLWDTLLSLFYATEPYDGTRASRANLREFSRLLIRRFVEDSLGLLSDGENVELHIRPEMTCQVDFLKRLTWHYVISNPRLRTTQYGQKRILRELLEIYSDDINGKRALLTPAQREFAESSGVPWQRIVSDVISILTEKQAVMLHRRLTGDEMGSILDTLP